MSTHLHLASLAYSAFNYSELFESFKGLKVLVLGDVMIDAYFYGKVERISPEAPVPVVSVDKKESRLGGAGNVALNLKALGAEPILVSVCGDDRDGHLLRSLIEAEGLSDEGIVTDADRLTTVKTRIIGNNHHVLRVDSEQLHPLSADLIDELKENIDRFLEDADVVVLEDYNKGVLVPDLIKHIITNARLRNIPTVVDPKKEHFFSFQGVTLFKPNRKELIEGMNTDRNLRNRDEILLAAKALLEKLKCEQVMITLSEDGILICSKEEHHFIPAHPRKIVDVSGAGDTVVAVAALCLARNTPMNITAELSNLAGGLVCENLGVVPLDSDTLLNETLQLK